MGRNIQSRREPAPDSIRGRLSRALTASARRMAGAFLLATFALLAVAPKAEAQAPSAPMDVTFTNVTAQGMRVNWTDVSGVTGYTVEWRKNGATNWMPPRTRTFFRTFEEITSLEPNTLYDVRVKFINGDVEGPYTTEQWRTEAVTITVTSNRETLSQTNLDGAELTVTMNGLRFQRFNSQINTLDAEAFNFEPEIQGLDVTAATYINNSNVKLKLSFDGNIAEDIEVKVKIKPNEHSGSLEVVSSPFTVKALAAPSNVRIGDTPSTEPTANRLVLLWDAYPTIADFRHFELQYKASTAGTWTVFTISNPGATNAQITTGLNPLTTYNLRLRVCTSAATNPCSAWAPNDSGVAATTVSTDARIAATDPSPLTEDGLDGAKVTVEFVGRPHQAWEPNLLAGQFTASGVPGVRVSAVERLSDRRARLTLAYDDTDFDEDRTLRIRIAGIAYNYGGHITAATGVQAVVEAPPVQVENVRLTPGPQRVKVKWDAVPTARENLDRNRYRVQWKESASTGGWRELKSARGSRTSYTIPGLNPGTEYAVRVIATRRKAPDGPPSEEARAVTPAFRYSIAGTEPAELTGANLNGATIAVRLQGAEWELAVAGRRHRVELSGLETGVWVDRLEHVSPSELRVVLGHRGPWITEDGDLRLLIRADLHGWKENVEVTAPVKAPERAGGLQVAEVTDSTVTLVWGRVEGNDVYYRVRWKESASDGGWRARWTRGPDAPGRHPFYQIKDLTPGTEYTVQVRSWDRGGAGWGRWSSATMTTTVGGTSPQQRAGVTVSAGDPVPVDEGGSASYTVVLDGRPTGDVTIAVSSDNADVTTQPASLTFTADDWYTPRTVTVSAARDGDAADDAATLSHAVSGAGEYAGIAVASVAVAVTDDDGAGVTVSETSLSLEEGGSATYTVVLDTRPVGDVVIDPVAHGAGLTAAPSGLTFTPENWDQPQTVTVSAAQDDDAADGEGAITHATLADAGSAYAGIAIASVTVSVTDDDAAAQAAEEPPPWTLELVRDDRPFTTVAETDADAAYASTFLRLVRGSSTAPLPQSLPVTVGGTAANPADYEFNHGNAFASLSRKSADLMRGARKITVKGDGVDEGDETITFSVTIEGETLTATLTITDDDGEASSDATLAGLAVSGGRLSSAFDAATTAYEAIVPEAASSIAVTPTAAQADATVTVNGVAVESGSPSGPVAVSEGSVVTVRVTAPDGATVQDYLLTVAPQPPWLLRLVRNDRPFETVAEMETDAEYPSTFLRLERGSSTAPMPESLPVTVGGTAANPADYEFNQGNKFTTVNRKSDDLMRGARKITVKGDGVDEGPETVTFSVTIGGETLTATLTIAEPRLAVADASVEEAAGAALAFRVTLAPPVGGPVTVDWATADGSAVAGVDYTAGSGTLTFLAGETEKTISVAVLDDDHDEGSETMTLTLSNPSSGVALGDAEATGTIGNTDLMPQAWLARFGRTVADQVIDAVTARFEAAPQPGSAVSIAGQAMGAGGAPEAQAACAARRAAHRDRHGLDTPADGNRAGSGTGGLQDRCRSGTRALTGRDLLTGSSFSVTGGSAETGFGTVWGSGAVTRFDGREGELTLDGDVASALLGADFRRDRATVGLALAHSRGDGSYRGAGSGKVESTLTGFYPYGRYAVSERLSLWGIAGWGAGTLTLKPEDGARVETDIDMAMAAAGARGVLAEAPDGGGPELAAKSDALLLRISSDAARDGDGGRLAAADADVTRLRLGLEGTWRGVGTEGGGTLTPTLEAGLRHDGGDAETGFGVEAGAGLAWADPASGVNLDLKARGLLTHEADGFRERGVSGSFAWDPAPGSDRGPSLALTQTMGASASDGVDALFRDDALAGLDANGDGLDARRFETKLGYGFGAFGDRLTMTPELGFGLSNDSRTYGLGWRLNPSGGNSSFELRLDATRREAANDDAEPEHGFQLRLNMRW